MTNSNTVLPTTIDEVIDSLDRIVIGCERDRCRMGYFPAMYNRVTRRVKRKILAGEFEDNPRMELFDVIFANRYLEAHYAYKQGKPCSQSWAGTFIISIDPGLFAGKDEYMKRAKQMVDEIKSAKPIEGKEVVMPGELGDRRVKAAEESGEIEIADGVWNKLCEFVNES